MVGLERGVDMMVTRQAVSSGMGFKYKSGFGLDCLTLVDFR